MNVDILAFAAHPDDIEISASGTLMKHIDMGKTVAIVDLTQGELGSRGNVESRHKEAKLASEIMGIKHRVNLKLSDGFFELNQQNKIKIIEQIRHFKPTVVLCNAISDRHPDHGRASQLVSEACFLSGLLKIETEFNNVQQEKWRPIAVYHYIQDRYIKPDFVVDISDYVDRKIEVLKAYKTQFFNPKITHVNTPISGKDFFDFLKGRWKDFGRNINVNYAEGFTVERVIGIEDITTLK
ncbi:MAG TPA: bacillithiol biosynthesis deacetylase BshB1 [Crocinitomix sp.]|nr:bacillithiol biosynthesis deacetylase BshB1 [Crocinitomix sp.]